MAKPRVSGRRTGWKVQSKIAWMMEAPAQFGIVTRVVGDAEYDVGVKWNGIESECKRAAKEIE